MASVNHQDFQKLIAQVVFQGRTDQLPSSFYLGLATGLLPAKDATLASITEVAGPGYARALLNRDEIDWANLYLSNNNWKVSSDTRRFAAVGGNWTAADFCFLTDAAAGTVGRLFLSATLNEPFLLLDNDTWDGSADWLGTP